MRTFSFLFVVTLATAAGAQTAFEQGFSRPGGVYASVSVASAQQCARACADDNLCMSWTLVAETCELKAVIPSLLAQEGAVSGLSQRAPEWSRLIGAPAPAAPAASEEPTNEAPAETAPAVQVEPPPPPPRDTRADVEAAFSAPQHAAAQPDAYPSLLGGLQSGDPADDEPITLNTTAAAAKPATAAPEKTELRARIPSGRPSR